MRKLLSVALAAALAVALAAGPTSAARASTSASLSYTYDGDYLTVTATVSGSKNANAFYGVGIQCEDELGNQTFPENDPGGYMTLNPYPILWGDGTATTNPRFISPTSTAPPNVSNSLDPWGYECYVAIWKGTNYRQLLAWFEFVV